MCRARLKDGAGFDAVSKLLSHWEDLTDKQKITYANAAHATRSAAPAQGLLQVLYVATLSHFMEAGRSEAQIYVHFRLYMDPEEETEGLPSRKEIAHLFSMLACNSHTICDDEEHPIGTLLLELMNIYF